MDKIKEHYLKASNIEARIKLSTEGFTGKLITHNFKKITNLLAPYKEGENVIDVGCGFGYLMYFLPTNVGLYGLDISSTSLQMARKFRKDFTGIIGDAHSMPFEDNEFDKLFCINLTPHLLDIDKALKECFRIIKPNGLAVINFLNKFGLTSIHFTVFKIRYGYYFKYDVQTPVLPPKIAAPTSK